MSDSKEQVVIASFDGPADAEQADKDLIGIKRTMRSSSARSAF
jgi:hypothetical protein